MATADTKFIIICSSQSETLRMYDDLREFLASDLGMFARLINYKNDSHCKRIITFPISKIVIDIYSPYLKFCDGVRYDYFAISARSDSEHFEQVQQLRYYLSRSGTELTTLHAIKEKIKEIYLKEKTDATYSLYKLYNKPNTIKNVIFNDPATIVFWYDGTKTVVKAQGYDIFDPEKGLAMAIAKKFMGNKGNYCNELKKWLPKEEKTEEEFDLDAFKRLIREKIAEALTKSPDEEPNV